MRWLLLLVALASCKRFSSPTIDADTAPSASIYAIETFKASTGGDESVVLVVTITADGAIMFGARALKDETELGERTRERLRQSPNLRVAIDADKTVPFGRVITVLDTLKRSGVTRISFGTGSVPRVEHTDNTSCIDRRDVRA